VDLAGGAHVKTVVKWLCVTIGLTALWMVTRAVVFYFVGVAAVFATAFQATVHTLTRMTSDESEEMSAPAPELRIERDARLVPAIVDLTAVEERQQSAV
jgi:hypothetical protein